MPHEATSATELTSHYVNQVASDLDRNVKGQERIAAEIAALQQELAALQHDHAVLMNMQQALGIAATAEPAHRDSLTRASRKDATAGSRRETAAAGQSAAKKSTITTASAKAAHPTLVELVCRYLIEQSEPRSAAEVATKLSQANPERGIKTTVVRTTLENLVAKNRAQRVKQGSSVFYIAPQGKKSTAVPKSEPQPETVG
ncbi:hypothetical protein [Streptomyces chartreusis]|uniref:hypothetical protein n=1 Tax=Streptomyces chartreusis TaxID=1969 RepID=UPI003829894A